MTLLKQILKLGAYAYAFVCVVQVLFLPAALETSIDNVLFLFAVGHVGILFLEFKAARVPLFLFAFFFAQILAIDLLHGNSFQNISYLMYFLKWPVLLLTLMFTVQKASIPVFVHWFFIALVGINLFLLINPFGWGEILQNLYAPKAYTNFTYYNEPGAFRLVGTQMNPNDNAVVFGLFYIFFLFYQPKRWQFLVLAASFILLTQSRTVFLFTALLTVVWLVRLYWSSKHRTKLFWVGGLGIAGLSALIVFSENLRSIFTGAAFESGSLHSRFENLSETLHTGATNLMIGNGVVDSQFLTNVYIDSEYIALILQFGITGLCLYLLLLFALLRTVWRLPHVRNFWIAIIGMILFVNLTNFTLLHGGLGVLFATFLGAAFFDAEPFEETPIVKPRAAKAT